LIGLWNSTCLIDLEAEKGKQDGGPQEEICSLVIELVRHGREGGCRKETRDGERAGRPNSIDDETGVKEEGRKKTGPSSSLLLASIFFTVVESTR
jgi:hypothetical protein